MHADGGALASEAVTQLHADLRPLLEPGVGLIGALMMDYVCIAAESRLAAATLLLTTACVPAAPLLALVAPALFMVLRGPARSRARTLLAPQPPGLAPLPAATRTVLASTLLRIRRSTRRWP